MATHIEGMRKTNFTGSTGSNLFSGGNWRQGMSGLTPMHIRNPKRYAELLAEIERCKALREKQKGAG